MINQSPLISPNWEDGFSRGARGVSEGWQINRPNLLHPLPQKPSVRMKETELVKTADQVYTAAENWEYIPNWVYSTHYNFMIESLTLE